MLPAHLPTRTWRTWEEKLQLLQEAEKTSIWKVAREQGIPASQMYVWRKQLKALTTGTPMHPPTSVHDSIAV